MVAQPEAAKSDQMTFFYHASSLWNSLDKIPLNFVTLLVILSINLKPNYLLLSFYLLGRSVMLSCNFYEYLLKFGFFDSCKKHF